MSLSKTLTDDNEDQQPILSEMLHLLLLNYQGLNSTEFLDDFPFDCLNCLKIISFSYKILFQQTMNDWYTRRWTLEWVHTRQLLQLVEASVQLLIAPVASIDLLDKDAYTMTVIFVHHVTV